MNSAGLSPYRAEWDRLRRALTWRYGEARTAKILAGRDADTNRDLACWRALGRAAA